MKSLREAMVAVLDGNDLESAHRRRLIIPSPSRASEPWTCPRCGRAWPERCVGFRRFKPDPSSPIVEGCETCVQAEIVQPQLRKNRLMAHGMTEERVARMTLESFEPLTKNECAAKEAAYKTVDRWAEGSYRSLILWSPIIDPPERRVFGERAMPVSGCGCGKTHLAYGLARKAIDLDLSIEIITEIRLLETIKAGYGDGGGEAQPEITGHLCEVGVLILDEVGGANVKSKEWYQGIMYEVIDGRYRAGRPFVLTTNLDPVGLAERLGPRIASRLEEMAVPLKLDGPDRRRRD